MIEPELLASARQGGAAGWEAIVGRNQEAVFRMAYLLVGDADDAQDITQETFIRAYQALDRFDASRPMRPWLLRIAANLARNRRRALGRYLSALQRALRAEPGPASPGVAAQSTVEALSAQALEAQSLWQAVRHLAPADQEVIYLRFFLELPEADMAAALGVAPGTIKSRLHRALKRLRAVVEESYPDLQGKLGA